MLHVSLLTSWFDDEVAPVALLMPAESVAPTSAHHVPSDLAGVLPPPEIRGTFRISYVHRSPESGHTASATSTIVGALAASASKYIAVCCHERAVPADILELLEQVDGFLAGSRFVLIGPLMDDGVEQDGVRTATAFVAFPRRMLILQQLELFGETLSEFCQHLAVFVQESATPVVAMRCLPGVGDTPPADFPSICFGVPPTHELTDGVIRVLPTSKPPFFLPTAADDPIPCAETPAATVLLSLCMIVRDNEAYLRECLASVRPWVDELVIVDTGSNDTTPQIARDLGARVYLFPWCDDFAAARNESLRHARGQWLFWMDSDDTLTADNGRRLRELASGPHQPGILGYVMQVLCPGNDHDADLTIVDHVKLIRHQPELRFEGRIHEQILPAIRRAGGDVAWTDIQIHHTHGSRTPEQRACKHARDLRLLELELRDHPEHPFTLFNFGMTYADMGRHDEAVHALCRSILVGNPGDSQVRKAYALLASSLMALGRGEAALEVVDKGLKAYPEDLELHFRRGVVLQMLGRRPAAIESYAAALRASRGGYFSSLDRGIGGYKCRHNLALIYQELRQLDDAAQQWQAALEEEPTFTPAWRGLIEIELARDNTAAANRLVKQMHSTPTLSAAARLVEVDIALQQGQAEAADQLLQAAYAACSSDDSVVRRYCQRMFERARWSDAEQGLLRLARMCPEDASVQHNLCCVYLNLGAPAKARECCQRALIIDPKRTQSRELLLTIEGGPSVASR